jgi:hypothetical protein
MVNAKSTLRRKKNAVLLLTKAEHQLSCQEAILSNIEEISDIQETAQIVVAIQRDHKHINVEKMYAQVSRASDGLATMRELVGDTNQALGANASESVIDDSMLDAELEAYLAEPASSDAAVRTMVQPTQLAAPAPVRVEAGEGELKQLYARYMVST